MLFDDRLATVLRSPAQTEAAARTQFRQLLDLLGTTPADLGGALVAAAYQRIADLAEALPAAVQAGILRAPGLRLRNRVLVGWLAEGDPQAAAAAMATAQLTEDEWLGLVPKLSVTARGFLRHRRDLPEGTRRLLERLGVTDLVLPEPDQPPAPEADDDGIPPEIDAGIGNLVRRIEAFQQARREGTAAPRLPLGDVRPVEAEARGAAFDFTTDAAGTIVWADPAMAPLAVGLRLPGGGPASVAALDPAGQRAMSRRLPLRGARVTLAGPDEIAGTWRLDAAPAFTHESGAFDGYRGRMRRPALARRAAPANSAAADRMRQLLHELRTPVNAIQGFAELIQQQMFGPAPNEYRALAAGVAVDAARLLAGFDEIDRLARLQTGAFEPADGQCDLREVLARLLHRLEGVLRPRSARIELRVSGHGFTVDIGETEAQQLVWRLLATFAGVLAPGEVIDVDLASDGRQLTLGLDLPTALLGDDDLFAATAPAPARAISAGMFGTGFTLRLARAEAEASHGALARGEDDRLRLTLPVVAGPSAAQATGRSGGAAA